MSTLYGDSIFESNEYIIDRIIESIDNDSKLFRDYIDEAVINESAVDSIKKFIIKVKEFVENIIDKFKEAIRKVKSSINAKLVKARWTKALENKETPFTISIINYKNINNFYEKLNIYINDGKNMLNNIDSISVDKIKDNHELLNTHVRNNELGYIYHPSIKKQLYSSAVYIDTEERKKEYIDKNLDKLIKESVDMVTVIEKQIKSLSDIKYSLYKLEDKYDKKTKDADKDLKGDNKYRELAYYYFTIVDAGKDLIKLLKYIYTPNFIDNTVVSN